MRSHDPEECQTANMYNLLEFGSMYIVYDILIDVNVQTFPGASGVWFSLRNITYQNNSCVTLEDIGEGDDALLCVTNLTTCCLPPYTVENGSVLGDWFSPNGTRVCGEDDQWDSCRNRGQMVIRLNRQRGGVEGIYRCEIPDSTNILQTIYIGVYTANTGE